MEAPELTCPASPARDQPAPVSGPPGAPGGQASPHLTLGPVLLPPEQGRAPTVFLKALPIPLYHTVPPGGLQPRAPLVTGSLDGGGGSVPFLLSPLLQPEGPGPTPIGKPATPTLTVNIVGTLPVLSPCPGPVLGGPGKARHAGKYLCPHCGRDCLKPSVLEKHIRSHTGERPFPCATCGIAFKTQSNLYKHRRTQTHFNNARLSSESEGAGGSLLEEGDKAGETSRAASKGDSWSQGGAGGAPPERPLSPGAQGAGHCSVPPTHLSPVSKNLDPKLEAVCCPGQTPAEGEARMASTGLPAAGSQPRRPPQEPRGPPAGRACSLPQPQAPSSEKPGDTKASEGRLRKCESTDSGYLSRSDSVEQPLPPGSPLRSLSEHRAESEGEGATGPRGTRAERGGRGPSLELEKRQLEERIARLISHNQAVVDDPQLDHVRPRKTVLSKQGSIDLPMPYTYKDSFHFEIRALEPGRRRPGALGPARSTCTPLDKARPLFFHSVPTQLSTTSECVAVTRSNSLPFVEGTRTWKEPLDPQDSGSWRQKPLSPRPTPARMADVPGGHPRALVRQAAVEDLPGPPTRDTMTPTEDPDGKRVVAGDDGAAGKGRGAGRKRGQRRLQMFSQEKWQVYGRETFQRLYQKMRASRQGGRRAREGGVGCGVEQDLPPKGGAAGGEGAALSQDSQTLICGDSSVGPQPGPLESPPATEVFLVTESPERRETAARAGGTEQPRESRSVLPPTCTCREPPSSGSKSPVLPARGRLEMGCPLPPALGPLKGGDLEAPRLPDPKLEGGAQGGGDTEEQALLIPRDPGSSPGEPQTVEPRLPSERKKLRVEGPTSPEQRGTLGAGGQALGPPGQATPLPPWKQDSDPGDKPGELHRGSECPVRGRARASGARGASFSASSVALTPGLRDKEPGLGPEASFPGIPSPLAPQPQAPDTPAALTDTTFPPKYLLRLPQGESPSPPPGAQGRLCRTWGPEDLVSSLGSEPGTLLSPRPAAGLAPGRADSFEEDPGLWGCRKGALGEEEGGLDAGTAQSGEPAGWSAGALKEAASVLPTWACDSWRSETHGPGPLCSRSSGTRAQASPSILDPRPLNRDVAKPPENVPEDPPPGPPAGQHPYCSLRASSAFSSTLLPPGRPGVASGTPSGSPGGCGPQGPFPSLKAEPQLTWCCLSRSLPLPAEQKGKAASVCWALHRPGRGSLAQGADTRLASKAAWGRWTRTSPAEGGETRPWKLSYLTAPGVTSRDPGTEPAWKKGPPRRRAKLSRASSKQKTLRRYRGSFLQGRVQLRARRLRKPLWVLRKDCHPPPLEGLDPRRTLGQAAPETAELSLLEEPSRASSGSPLGGGKGEKEEQDRGPTAGGGPPSASPTHRDPPAVQDGILSAGEPGDCCPRDTLVSSGLSLPPDSYIQVARNGLPSYGTGLDVRFLETQQPSPQEQVPADPKLCVVSDARDPLSFEPKGNSLRRDVATPVVGICTSLGARGGHTTMGSHRAETQEQDRAAGETVTCGSSPDRKAAAQGTSPSLLPGKPSPGPRLSGLVPARTPGKTHPEISASGPGSRREEERPKMPSPSGGHPGCGEMLVPGPPPGKNSGTCQESGLVALKGRVVPSKPEASTEVPQAPSKTMKKRSLEGMRKQSRVEFSDTSSDDEDRLVIEI